MSIRAICPACRTVYSLPENLQGKKIRCKQCQEVFTAGAAPPAERGEWPEAAGRPGAGKAAAQPRAREEKPAWPARRTDRDLPPGREKSPAGRRRSSTLPLALILGGSVVAALLLMVIGEVAVWFLTRSVSRVDPSAAATPAGQEPPPPAPAAPAEAGPPSPMTRARSESPS